MVSVRKLIKSTFFILGIISFIAMTVMATWMVITKTKERNLDDKYSLNDGPHVFYLNDSIINTIFIKNSLNNNNHNCVIQEKSYNYSNPLFNPEDSLNITLDFELYKSLISKPDREYSATRIAAVSDIHGCYNTFVELLKSVGIINDSLNWCWNEGHLVIIGDIIDKGPYVTECLWLVKKLENQAEKAGGEVHYLLGNHEIYLLSGITDFISYKHRRICDSLHIGYDKLYSINTELGRWLRTKKIAVKINDNLFVHGGISAELTGTHHSINDINTSFLDWFQDQDFPVIDTGKRRVLMLLKSNVGPLEFRGYFNKNIFNRKASKLPVETIDLSLQEFHCNHIIVGHTVVKEILPMFNGKVIAIDLRLPEADVLGGTSNAQMLLIENGNYYKVSINKTKVQIL